MTKTNNNEPQTTTPNTRRRALHKANSKLIGVLTNLLQAVTLGTLGLSFGNLLGLASSLETGHAVLLLLFGLLTLATACGIQFLDPTNGDAP